LVFGSKAEATSLRMAARSASFIGHPGIVPQVTFRCLPAGDAGLRADDSDEARQRYARAREAYAAAEAEGLRLLGIGQG
jgi:hypothetical protein